MRRNTNSLSLVTVPVTQLRDASLRLIILPPNSSDTKHNAMAPIGDPHVTQHAVDVVDCNVL
jgi:hypothetical protein